MLRFAFAAAASLSLAVCYAGSAAADDLVVGHNSVGTIVLPDSSQAKPGSAGLFAHTHIIVVHPDQDIGSAADDAEEAPSTNKPPKPGLTVNTPASVACIYMLVTQADGCDPNLFHTNSTGGSKTIAIVDACDDPNVRKELTTFSKQFGLPKPTAANFKVVFASGKRPNDKSCNNGGAAGSWITEIALDTQWVHAIAPHAKIILVEAKTNSFNDLLVAEDKASALVAKTGGEVTNSWGGGIGSSDPSNDSHFLKAGVVFFASTGDAPGPEYPSTSPNVVAVGGTHINRESNKQLSGSSYEVVWSDTGGNKNISTGGGIDTFEAKPSFQNGVSGVTGTHRNVPDVAAIADPDTGVWVRVGTKWEEVGGTSLASPVMAAIVNLAGGANNSNAQNTTMYGAMGTPADWFDVVSGACGPISGGNHTQNASTGYDLCSGIGAPRGLAGK